MRGGSSTARRVPPWLVIAVVMAAAAWPAAGTVAGSSHTAIAYPTGSAHLAITDLESGAHHAYDLPVYPPPSGLRGDLLQVSEVRDPFGSRPAQTEWFENIGRMQFWFADLSAATSEPSAAASFLGITGPLQLGTSEAGQFSALNVMVRRPGQPYGAENQSAAGGRCTFTVAGDPKVELTGTLSCTKLTSIFMNGLIPQPPDIDVEATFSIRTGAPAPTPESKDIDVAFDHIEVVQVVQDAGNTVPLVAGKTTVARVFVRVNEPAPVADVVLQVSLTGLRDGVSLSPPLPSITLATVVRPSPNRTIKTESANFVLPLAWVRSGTLGLQASVSVAEPWHETRPDDNDGIDAVDFEVRRPFLVAHVPVCFGYDAATRTYAQCPGNSNNKGDVIGQLYPAPDGGVDWYEIPYAQFSWSHSVSNPFSLALLLRSVESRWELARAASIRHLNKFPDQVVAMIPAEVDPAMGGLASGFNGDASVVAEYRSTFTSWSVPHEVGHNLGLFHTASGDPRCKRSYDFGLGDWPRDDDSIGELGWNVVLNDIVQADRKDLMSYCRNDELWIGPFHYRKLFDSRWGDARVSAISGAVAGRAAAVTSGAGDFVFVRGTIRRDLTGGSLEPAFTVRAESTPPRTLTATSGSACIVLSGPGLPASQRCFEPTFTLADGDDDRLLEEAPFHVVVPVAAGVREIALTLGGRGVATLAAGRSSPTVESDPRAGETWAEPRTLSWTATTAAAKDVTILYSPDGGELWLPFALELPADSIEIDPSRLVAGSENLFRILVSDGVVTASTDVGPITVPESIGREPLPTRDELPEPGPGTTEPPTIATTPPDSPSVPGSIPTRGGLPLPIVVLGGGLLVLLLAVGFIAARSRSRRVVASGGSLPPGSGMGTPPPPSGFGPPPPAHAPTGSPSLPPAAPQSTAPPPSPWLQAPPAPQAPPPQAPMSSPTPHAQPAAAWPAPAPVRSGQPMRSLSSALGVLGGLATVVFGALGFAAASVGPDAIGPDPTVVIAISIVGVLGGVVALAAAVASRRRQP